MKTRLIILFAFLSTIGFAQSSGGGFTSFSKVRITTDPTSNPLRGKVLVRDSVTGNLDKIEYSDLATAISPFFPFVSLTTAGTSGASTLSAGNLNIPRYDLSTTYVVDGITDMEFYDGESTTVIVKDSLRGGLFNYVSTGTIDNGIVFNATGKGSGYWKRQYAGDIFPQWFGVVGDGTTDDTVNIQACLNSIFSEKATIYFPKGLYIISDSINIPYSCKIKGNGGKMPYDGTIGGTPVVGEYVNGSSQIIQTQPDKSAFIFQEYGSSMEDMSITCTAETPTSGEGVRVVKGSSFYMVNTFIGHFYDNLYFESGVDIMVNSCQFANPQRYGVYLGGLIDDEGDNTFYGNMFNGSASSTATYFRADYCGGLRINNNKFHIATGGYSGLYASTAIDIVSHSTTGDVLIMGNSIEAYVDYGIRIRMIDSLKLLSKILINDNQFANSLSGASERDISIESPVLGNIYGVSVSDNYIANYGAKASILLENVDYASISGNVFNNNSVSQMYTITNSTNVTFPIKGTLRVDTNESTSNNAVEVWNGASNVSGTTKTGINYGQSASQNNHNPTLLQLNNATQLFTTSTEVDLNNYRTNGNFLTPASGLLNLPVGTNWTQKRYMLYVAGGQATTGFSSQIIIDPSNGDKAYRSTNTLAGWGAWRYDIAVGGNTQGSAVSVGTNDNFSFSLKRNNIDQLSFTTTGIGFLNGVSLYNLSSISRGYLYLGDASNSPRIGTNNAGSTASFIVRNENSTSTGNSQEWESNIGGTTAIRASVSKSGVATVATDLTRKDYVDTALALKAPLASPTFTGSVIVPTATLPTQAVNLGQVEGLVDAVDLQTVLDNGSTATSTTDIVITRSGGNGAIRIEDGFGVQIDPQGFPFSVNGDLNLNGGVYRAESKNLITEVNGVQANDDGELDLGTVFVPRAGTGANPITGDFQVNKAGSWSIYQDNVDSFSTIGMFATGAPYLTFQDKATTYNNSLIVNSTATVLNSENPTYKGFVSTTLFNKGNDPLAFKQMGDSFLKYTTTEILALTPTAGDTYYNTTLNVVVYYDGTTWQKLSFTAM